MTRRETPTLVQIERQARITLVLLPFVSALPWVDEEVIAKVFGQAMGLLNWTSVIAAAFKMHRELPPEAFGLARPRPRTQEEWRLYWREAKREERRRKLHPQQKQEGKS